jgi:hypothetical protein
MRFNIIEAALAAVLSMRNVPSWWNRDEGRPQRTLPFAIDEHYIKSLFVFKGVCHFWHPLALSYPSLFEPVRQSASSNWYKSVGSPAAARARRTSTSVPPITTTSSPCMSTRSVADIRSCSGSGERAVRIHGSNLPRYVGRNTPARLCRIGFGEFHQVGTIREYKCVRAMWPVIRVFKVRANK